MIYLGLDPAERCAVVDEYRNAHGIRKVFVISPKRFAFPGYDTHVDDPVAHLDGTAGRYIDWPHVIEYRYYYRLLQEIDSSTLVVVNEGLRTQNRHDLAYNCIRSYVNQTRHVLVLNYLPVIDTIADFMVLVDWVTRSRWKREPFSPAMLAEVSVRGRGVQPSFTARPVQVSDVTRATYAAERERLFAEVRGDIDRDPHIIPRNLYLVAGRDRAAAVKRSALGRNNRIKLPDLATYRDVSVAGPRTVFEFPHNVIEYADALAVTRASNAEVIVADTKADRWYFDRFTAWAGRVRDAATALHG